MVDRHHAWATAVVRFLKTLQENVRNSLKNCRSSFWILSWCFSWALSVFFPHRLHVACSFVISSWDSVCSSAISKNLVGSSEISERQSIYPPPTSCFLPWSSCMDFLPPNEEFVLTLSSNNIKCIFLNLEFK